MLDGLDVFFVFVVFCFGEGLRNTPYETKTILSPAFRFEPPRVRCDKPLLFCIKSRKTSAVKKIWLLLTLPTR